MFFRVILILAFYPLFCSAQENRIRIGVEQDVLPYITKGYFAGGWIGKDHFRLRLVHALVNKPDFIVPEGFTNNRTKAYAAVGDYFLKSDWTGWYAGTGLVVWDNSIQTDLRKETARYSTILINGTLGYSLKLNKHFYISPWAGMHFKIAGHSEVNIEGKTLKPALLNPEASVKAGFLF